MFGVSLGDFARLPSGRIADMRSCTATQHANTLLYILAFLRILLSQTANADERAAQRDRLGTPSFTFPHLSSSSRIPRRRD